MATCPNSSAAGSDGHVMNRTRAELLYEIPREAVTVTPQFLTVVRHIKGIRRGG